MIQVSYALPGNRTRRCGRSAAVQQLEESKQMTSISHTAQAGERLKNRRIAITGGAAGIGRRTAELFIAEGATVSLLDLDATGVKDTASAIGALGFATDVTDAQAIEAAFASSTAEMGGLDGLVTAAGIMWRGSVRNVGAEDWRRVIDINLTGTYLSVRSFLQQVDDKKDATIVTLGSGQGLHPNVPDRTAYAASKGGVVNLTRALAAELAPAIRVNCVCPGLVDTEMANGVRGNFGNYALGRIADPIEIAHAILFLTSFESSYVTGATLAADGGRSFH
jgi:NAD(P)-dependent dehydrogenase (short-subunit alcohol dehydrogenase family)